jgi:ADP-ribose pyrophosphatase
MPSIGPEETVRSETVFSGKLITVRRDEVRLRQGKTTEREIVVHAQTVAILPVLEDGRLVLVRQYRKAAEQVLLEAPAGGIDGDETPEEAVRREMIEETGYRAGALEHLCSFYTSPGFTTEYMHLYRATDLEPGEPTEETDQIDVVLLTPAEAWTRVESGEIADAKSILALCYARTT